jgi:hypothetical protein
MRVQTFIGKVTMDGLNLMDEHINKWLEEHNVEPKLVKQSFGYERPQLQGQQEPVIIVTVWY